MCGVVCGTPTRSGTELLKGALGAGAGGRKAERGVAVCAGPGGGGVPLLTSTVGLWGAAVLPQIRTDGELGNSTTAAGRMGPGQGFA